MNPPQPPTLNQLVEEIGLDEMVRDFTSVSTRSKSEVRQRIKNAMLSLASTIREQVRVEKDTAPWITVLRQAEARGFNESLDQVEQKWQLLLGEEK